MAERAVSAPALRHWRVRELASVTAEDLQRTLNEAAAEGWCLDRVDYIKEPGVRRPQLAFCYFWRDASLGPPPNDDAPRPSAEELVATAAGAWAGVYEGTTAFEDEGALDLAVGDGDEPELDLSPPAASGEEPNDDD